MSPSFSAEKRRGRESEEKDEDDSVKLQWVSVSVRCVIKKPSGLICRRFSEQRSFAFGRGPQVSLSDDGVTSLLRLLSLMTGFEEFVFTI